MQTLGSVIDQLSVVNLKIWFMQEKVYEAARRSADLEAAYVKDLASLNLLRNKLMSEIDEMHAHDIREGHANFDPRVKITD